MRSATLSSLLVPGGLADLAGLRSYARGAAYQRDGRVELGAVEDERVEAVVRGTMPYDVVLWVEGAELGWSCSCPVGEDGAFCKHCVAVGLAVAVKESGTGRSRNKAVPKSARQEVDLRAYVGTLKVSELVDLVMEQADADWRLRERLTARAMAERGSGIDERAWRRRLDAVFAPNGDFVDYREAAGWAAEVGDVVQALAEQADAGHAAAWSSSPSTPTGSRTPLWTTSTTLTGTWPTSQPGSVHCTSGRARSRVPTRLSWRSGWSTSS